MMSINWLKNNKYLFILALIGLVFLFVYSWLYIGSEAKFTSPDEAVNYAFILKFAETGELKITEPLNEIAEGLITPRNATAVGNDIVPASFLGIVLIYGFLAKIFGSSIIIYLTPIFSIIGVIFFYLLIKEIFSRQIAFISSLLLFILPPFWYYSARGMFHNVLYINFLIIGLYFLLRCINKVNFSKKAIIQIILSGVFVGLALITRTSEIVWVILCITAVIYFSKKIKWQHAIMLFCIIGITFIPIFFYNNQLFGSPLSFGYTQTLMEANNGEIINNSIINKVIKLVFPFGFDIERTGLAIYQYLILMFPWISILLLVGIIWFLKSIIFNKIADIFPELKKYYVKISNLEKLYFGLYLFVVIWLILYYGSYLFYEYYDRSEIILGSSYLRYWMPIFIFGLPILVTAILKIGNIFDSLRIKKFVIVFLVVGISIFSVNKVLADPLQSLFQIKKHIGNSASKANLIFSKTEPDSVIVSGFADKILFPERRVIVSLPSDKKERDDLVQGLLDKTNIYYFHSSFDSHSGQIIESLKNSGYEFEQVYYFVEDDEVLYKLH